MKSTIPIFLLFIVPITGFCQITPVPNAQSLIIKNRVKTSESYYSNRSSDSGRLIQKTEYDLKGQVMSEYILSIWDVVSYSHTTTCNYDDAGLMIETLKIQKVLNLFPRDEEYIESFGDMPVNERIVFEYDENGQLIKKKIFIFHTDDIPHDSSANQTITYQYEDGKLILEESTSPEVRIFNQNYSIKLHYDSAGNLIRKIRKFGSEKPMTRETRLVYDHKGNMIEKVVTDRSAPHNNTHEKYDYDSAGNLMHLYLFSQEEEEFELETSYKYDAQGHLVSGDREVQFEYYENGLIKSESWTDQKTNQSFIFKTQYAYF